MSDPTDLVERLRAEHKSSTPLRDAPTIFAEAADRIKWLEEQERSLFTLLHEKGQVIARKDRLIARLQAEVKKGMEEEE